MDCLKALGIAPNIVATEKYALVKIEEREEEEEEEEGAEGFWVHLQIRTEEPQHLREALLHSVLQRVSK